VPRPSPPGCPGAVPVPAGPQAPPVRCPADAHSSGSVAVVSRSKCESQAAARCLSFRTRPSILRQAAAAPPSAPGRIQAWSIARQEYPELVDLAARPRLTRRLGSRTKSAGRWVLLVRRRMLYSSRWVILGLAEEGVKRDGRQASGCRRQPVFEPRAGARADVTAPGPGCRRDGWPGCCGQHKSNTSPGPGGIQLKSGRSAVRPCP